MVTMKKTIVEKTQGFTKDELKVLEKFVFQKIEKQTHGRIQEVLNILQVKEFRLEYDLYSKSVKVTELLHLNLDFKIFFENLRKSCSLIIEVQDNKSLLEEAKSQKTDILTAVRTISEYGYRKAVTTTSLGKLKKTDEKSIQRVIELEAEEIVLKEELAKAQKALREAKEQALISARSRLCR